MIKESDKQYLQKIAEKYGSEILYNVLFEYSYGRHTYDTNMRSAGRSKNYAGLKGAAYSIPSFLLCTLISPPLSFILLIGAIANRISAKWQEQKGALGALNPFTWAEYIATGNYKNTDDEGNTIYNKAPHRTPANITDRQNIDSGDPDALKNTINQSVKNIDIFKLENLVFREWFIVFDNSEVVKIISYDEDNAKMAAKTLIDHPIMLKRLGAQLYAYERYKNIMNQQYSVYKAIFSDGQIFYTVGKNTEEASETAKALVKELGTTFDETYEKNHINVQKYKMPNLVRVEIQEKLEIPLPKKIKNISNYASVPGEENDIKKERDYFWQYGSELYQAKIIFSEGMGEKDFIMNFPAENSNMAKNILKDILSGFWETDYGKMLKANKESNGKWCIAKFEDGDRYIIHDSDNAKTIALFLYTYKMNICERYIKQNYSKILEEKKKKVGTLFSASSLSKTKNIPDIDNIIISGIYEKYDEEKKNTIKEQIYGPKKLQI